MDFSYIILNYTTFFQRFSYHRYFCPIDLWKCNFLIILLNIKFFLLKLNGQFKVVACKTYIIPINKFFHKLNQWFYLVLNPFINIILIMIMTLMVNVLTISISNLHIEKSQLLTIDNFFCNYRFVHDKFTFLSVICRPSSLNKLTS